MTQLTDSYTFRHGATVTNRIVQPPMQTFSGLEGGFVSEETLKHYQRRNQSAGLIIAEFHYVSENGGPASRKGMPSQLGAYSDAHLDGLTKLAQTIKAEGSKAILQIHHAGHQARARAAKGLAVYAPSALELDFVDYPLTELNQEQIDDIVTDFAKATKRAIQAGFDGVEIHGANHYLIQQFFSKTTNQRQDQYGGSLENRMGFAKEVTQAVSQVARQDGPKDFIVGYRISPQEIHDHMVGYTADEACLLVKELQQFQLDYVHLSLFESFNAKGKGSDQTFAEMFKQVMDPETALIIVGNIFDAQAAQEALALTDLIGIGRGILIEPDFAKKIVDGKAETIRSRFDQSALEDLAWTRAMTKAFLDPNSHLRNLPGLEK